MENKNEYREYSKLDEMRKKCPPEKWCWFSYDTTNTGAKAFFAIEKEALPKYKETFLQNKHIYEIIPAEQPLRPYFDLEMDDVDNHAGKLELFLSYLKTIFQTEFSLVPEYHILNSCRENKLSYHVILTNCHFNSMAELKAFIGWLFEDALISLKELHWKYAQETRVIFDKIPYGSSQNVRMINQSKRGKPYILKGEGLDPLDTMICKPSGVLIQSMKFKKPIQVQSRTTVSPDLNEKETIYAEEFLEYYKFNLLHDKALKGNWEDWRNMGFALYNTFCEKGLPLFDLFSQINKGKYNQKATVDFYTKLQVGGSKRITFNTIRMWAKKVDPKMFKRIFSTYIDKIEERVYCDTDDEASDAILLMLEGKILFVNRLYYKQDHVWIADSEKIKAILTNFIMSAHIFKDTDGKISQPWANYSSADKIYKTVLNKVQEFPCEKDKFHSTTKYRLCFKNGVLDLQKKRFYTWEQVDFEYYTVVQIPYDYEPSQSSVVMEVLQPLFGDDLPKALKYLARSLAGCVEDKNFATYLGNRNCGKGALASLLEAFGGYVRPFSLCSLCSQPRSKEDSKELYWLMEFEYVRIALSQEVPEGGCDLKSELVKKICSGGDTQIARRNYDRQDTLFKVECSMLLMGNDPIRTKGDVNEHRVSFEGAMEFKSAEFIELKRQTMPPEALLKYRVADPTIKDKCVSQEWWLAMVQLIMDHYTDIPLTVMLEEEQTLSVVEQFLSEYEWTKQDTDTVLGAELDHFGPKIKAELKRMGLVYKKCESRKSEYYKKWVFVGVKIREPTEQ